MNRKAIGRPLMFLCIVVILGQFGFAAGSGNPMPQEKKKKKEKPKAAQKEIVKVEKIQPVPDALKTGFESITAKDEKAYISFLSSDLLEGRQSTTRGYDIAAEYAASLLAKWGVKPAGDYPIQARSFGSRGSFARIDKKKGRTYFQEVELKEVLDSHSRILVQHSKGRQSVSKPFLPNMDYEYRASESKTITAPVVFAGYGTTDKEAKYDDFKQVDVSGKIVIMFSGLPAQDNPDSPFYKKEDRSPRRRRGFRGSPKIKKAGEKGAAAVILVESSPQDKPDITKKLMALRHVDDSRPIYPNGGKDWLSLKPVQKDDMMRRFGSTPVIRATRGMADTLLGYAGTDTESLKKKFEKDFKPHSFTLTGVTLTLESKVKERLTRCRNVVGYIEGSDPELKKEAVVIGAHLDHLGKRGDYIFNGADDNASGAAAILEMAEAFSLLEKKPKRSVVFALWTGEEKGFLGARYYVANPFFPMEKTASYINLDMVTHEYPSVEAIGKTLKRRGIDVAEEQYKDIDHKSFMFLTTFKAPHSPGLIKAGNQHVGMSLYLHKSSSGMGGSDFAAFAAHDIPWVSFHAYTTDDYHQPTDSIETLNFEIAEQITRLCWLTAYNLCDN